MKFSVIIPTLNSQFFLDKTLQSIDAAGHDVEIIVVDGGSDDSTVEVARRYGASVVSSARGRGVQLNNGAKQATGDILCFLHADTVLTNNFFPKIEEQFQNQHIQIGKCRMRFDIQNWLLNIYGLFTRFDSLWTSFGDQCIVVRRSFFLFLNGFPNWPLFEDVHFLRLSRREVKIHTFPVEVITSAKRFIKNGIFRQQIKNALLIIQYLKGVSPEILSQKYAN